VPYKNSASEEVEGELIALIERLGTLKAAARKARSPAEIDAAVAQMRLTINRGMRVGHTWAKEDLKKVFNDEYRLHSTQTKPKRDIDAAFNLRKKSRQSMMRLEGGLNSWVDDQGRNILVGKQIAAVEQAMKGAQGEDFVKLRMQAQGLRKRLVTDTDIPNITYFSKKGKHASVAEMPAPTYVRMALRAGHVDNENQGFIRGARQAGVEKVFCHDGDECGWASHDSLPLADGLEVSVEEALTHSKAHPNCVRYFTLPTTKERKAARERAKAREAAAKAARALARKQKAEKAKKAVQLSARIAISGVKAYRSPAIQLWIRNIAEDRFNLPAPIRAFAEKFLRYDTQERVVASSATMTERTDVSREEVRSRILDWADSVRGSPEQIHDVPPAMQRVLGLPPKASTERINSATQSYGDWIARKQGEVRSSEENVTNSSIWAQARDRLSHSHETQTSASAAKAQHYHLSESRGYNVATGTQQTVKVLVNAYKRDWEEITFEAVRSLAGQVDPLSWAKFSIGEKIRVSLGTSEPQRRELAGKIFKQIVDTRRYSDEDLKFAAQYGVKLVDKVTPEDVYRALVPRITLNPGGVFGFTVAAEGGHIKPVFRILPQGLVSRYFSYELTLASGAVGRVKAAIDEGKSIVEIMNQASEELISTFNVFRNGPVLMNAQFWGWKFNGFGVYAQGNQNWIRFAARYRRYQRFAWDSFSSPELQQIARDRGIEPTGTRAQLIARMNKSGLRGPQVKTKVNSLWTDVTVLPGGFGSLNLSLRRGDWTIMAALHNWSGNLVHMARELRADYAELKSWVEVAKKRFGEYYQRLKPEQLKAIRSLDDLLAYVKSFVDDSKSRVDNVEAAQFTVGNHNVSPLLEHAASKELKDDLDTFNNAWDQLFPHLRRPNFDVAGKEEQRSELEYRDGTIMIREDAAQDWKQVGHIARRNESIGFAPAGTGDTQGALWHEAGHHMADTMPARGYDQLFEEMKTNESFPQYIRDRLGNKPEYRAKGDFVEKFGAAFLGDPGHPLVSDGAARRWVRNNLSGYATHSWDELVSEAFKEFMTSAHPRPLATAIGNVLSRYGGEI
jgi:hypothetical protein